ncbi:hypothetical protein [Nocardioides albus]|uniref:Uncharacterized protein n=1 Tax=Nocardioides albus TaxID=1841 RepID=A0A7W5A1L7_9ACTN|nr:hypothetical protein [Nocardioides albus]MBB3087976.1 hypothetical protein [Nocardioides albus]GGU21719.1 hypothetical protein GCM10007979_20450 [Nocardioides albus]
MPTPLAQMLPEIVTLNVPGQPFSYYAKGNQIIDWWDIAKVTSLYPTQATHADESYRLNVTLDERNGSFVYTELRKSSEWKAEFTDDCFKLGGEMGGTPAIASRSHGAPSSAASIAPRPAATTARRDSIQSYTPPRPAGSKTLSSAGSSLMAGPTRSSSASSSHADWRHCADTTSARGPP